MKKSLLLLLTLFFLACKSEKTEKIKTEFDKTSNTEIDLDTLHKEPEPTGGDTSFMEFFEDFMHHPDFQLSRILFPVQKNGSQIKTSKDWRFLPFYSQSECYPILASDTFGLFERTVKPQPIQMFNVDFKKKNAESFAFDLENEKWYLNKIEKVTFAQLPDLDFINFFMKFSSDSVFQIESIAFPLAESYYDPEGEYEALSRTLQLNDWKFLNLTEKSNPLVVLSNIQKNHPYRNLFFRGVDNGIWEKYTFKKINKRWKLVRIEDYST